MEFPADHNKISLREKQVIDLVCQGKLNKEIAFQLHLSEGTIKEYVHRIFVKVKVSNRTELAVWALTRRESATDPSAHQPQPVSATIPLND